MTEAMEVKLLPAIATRALVILDGEHKRVWREVLAEAADLIGLDLEDGWTLNEKGTAFVRPKADGQKREE